MIYLRRIQTKDHPRMSSFLQRLAGTAILPTSQLVFQPRLLLLLLLFLVVGSQEPPPNYAHDMMPETNFTCSDKATGGYYADPEAGCQMFHVCVRVSDEEIRDFRFLCPNNTVFDQQNFICTNWWDIDCKRSTRYYSKNDLFRVDETTTNQDYEYEEDPFTIYEYVYEYDESQQTRNSPDYVYEYDDTGADGEHRFGAAGGGGGGARGRKGKSQDSTSSSSTTRSSTQTPPSTSTTTTTTSTTTTTPRPTTTTTTTTTTTSTTTTPRPVIRTTTPRITTLRPAHPFRTIRIGKPVVTISSSSRFETSSSSSSSSSSQGGGGGLTRFDSPRSQSSSTRTIRQEDLTDAEEDDLFSGVADPFANYDWRKDSSGVTASTKTRYEQRFSVGSGPRSRHNQQTFATASRNQEFTLTTARNQASTEVTTQRNRPSRGRSASPIITGTRGRASPPEEFSNFRYYKTAFGKNDQRDSSAQPSSSSAAATSFRSSGTGTRVRPAGYISARSASRNTRYSVYG